MSSSAVGDYEALFAPQADRDDTELRILEAAVSVIAQFGFRRFSLEEVARKAGLSRVTIYRRFGDKDTLIQAVVVRESQRSLQEIVRAISKLDSAEEQFVRGFVATVMVARQHPVLRQMLGGGDEIVLPRYMVLSTSQVMDLGRNYMSAVITGLQRKGRFPNADADATAELLIRLWHSIVLVPSGKLDPDDEAGLLHFARAYLYPLLSRDKPGHA